MIEREGGADPAIAITISDVLLAFGLGFIGTQRVEMGLRAKRLLVRAKAGSGAQ